MKTALAHIILIPAYLLVVLIGLVTMPFWLPITLMNWAFNHIVDAGRKKELERELL